MSDLAIAAVTVTLRNVLSKGVEGVRVTTFPPDRANQEGEGSRLNLFLYHIAINAGWRNQEIPTKVKPGESGYSPLPLTLHYMLTAYGNEADEADHRLLGTGMRVLYDHPVLHPDELRKNYDESRLRAQDLRMDAPFEAVRLTSEPLSVEEMSKLWTTFQTQYRVSASYQASAVLLESKRAIRKSLPVLKRGERDRGANVVPMFPSVLKEIEYRDWRLLEPRLPAGQLGDVVTVVGERLPGHNAKVLIRDPGRTPTFSDPDADVVARLRPDVGSNSERLYLKLDRRAGAWVSGNLELLIEQIIAPDDAAESMEPRVIRSQPLQLALAPRISDGGTLNVILTTEEGLRKLIVHCDPPIRRSGAPDKLPQVSLILTPLTNAPPLPPISAEALDPDLPAVVKFAVSTVPPGEYRIRLQVETVETLMMKRVGSTFEFDEVQKVML